MKKHHSLVIYKIDRRFKAGEVKITTYDYERQNDQWMRDEIRLLQSGMYPQDKYRIELHETYRTRTNVMTGEQFEERFDTPYGCSPANESYWAN